MAVFAKKKGDEEKINFGLNRLMEEDPTITYETNAETRESILSGPVSYTHLDVYKRQREDRRPCRHPRLGGGGAVQFRHGEEFYVHRAPLGELRRGAELVVGCL